MYKRKFQKDRFRQKKKKEVTLHHAAICGNLEKIMILLNKGVDINAQDASGNTALHKALEYGDYECLCLLLRQGADANITTRDGFTALHLAADFNLPDYISCLIEFGRAEVDALGVDNLTPLLWAVSRGNLECVKVLLRYGANVNARLTSGTTALHRAMTKKDEECIDILISHGANIFLEDEMTVSPLQFAAELGIYWFKKLLPSKIHRARSDGTTTLHIASKCVNVECLEYLIENGCNVNVQNHDGDTPLHFACTVGKYYGDNLHQLFPECSSIGILMKAGAKIHQKNKIGLAPVHVCAKLDCHLSLHYLKLFGSDLNIRAGKKNYTPLHFAAEAGNLKCLEYLKSHNVDKTCVDSENCTALMLAAKNCHFTCVKFLLQTEVPLWPAESLQ